MGLPEADAHVYQPIRIGVMRLMLLRAAAGVHPIVRHLTRYYERELLMFNNLYSRTIYILLSFDICVLVNVPQY